MSFTLARSFELAQLSLASYVNFGVSGPGQEVEVRSDLTSGATRLEIHQLEKGLRWTKCSL